MMKFISKFALVVLILAALYLLISGNLFSFNIFFVIQVFALTLMPWARRSFHQGQFTVHAEPKAGQMITSGPYKFIRHPMYTSALLIIWSGIFGHFSSLNLSIGLIVTGVVFIRILVEEQYLRAHYPEYVEFSKKTKLIIPFIL